MRFIRPKSSKTPEGFKVGLAKSPESPAEMGETAIRRSLHHIRIFRISSVYLGRITHSDICASNPMTLFARYYAVIAGLAETYRLPTTDSKNSTSLVSTLLYNIIIPVLVKN